MFRPHLTSVLSLSDVPKEVSGLSPCKSYINTKDYERECINEGLGKETLLYADEDILVYNKPENCQTAPGYVSRNSLACNVARDFKLERVDQMIAHRLDHGTSGVVVFARNVNALRSLHEQFRHNWIHKRYVARVHGLLPSLEGEIRLPIQRHIQSRPRVRIHPDGKYAHTEWHVLQVDRSEGKESCIVSLRPFTGRTHQLRIHLASIGHPILGDFFTLVKRYTKCQTVFVFTLQSCRCGTLALGKGCVSPLSVHFKRIFIAQHTILKVQISKNYTLMQLIPNIYFGTGLETRDRD